MNKLIELAKEHYKEELQEKKVKYKELYAQRMREEKQIFNAFEKKFENLLGDIKDLGLTYYSRYNTLDIYGGSDKVVGHIIIENDKGDMLELYCTVLDDGRVFVDANKNSAWNHYVSISDAGLAELLVNKFRPDVYQDLKKEYEVKEPVRKATRGEVERLKKNWAADGCYDIYPPLPGFEDYAQELKEFVEKTEAEYKHVKLMREVQSKPADLLINESLLKRIADLEQRVGFIEAGNSTY